MRLIVRRTFPSTSKICREFGFGWIVNEFLFRCISSSNPPIIVHCSAGIGRTGVLILMDTALALMEAREPVYPLDIVQTMRDQRACMVQNVVSIEGNSSKQEVTTCVGVC